MIETGLTKNDLEQIANCVFERLIPYLDKKFELIDDRLFEIEEQIMSLVASNIHRSSPVTSSGVAGACKDCRQSIVFMITKKGKPIPCDPGPGVIKNGDYLPGKHKCHHDTCPNKVKGTVNYSAI